MKNGFPRKFMKKTLLPCVLALSFLLAGCQGQKGETNSKADSETAKTGSNEHATFSATFIARPEQVGIDPSTYEVFQKLEKTADVTVKWQVYAQATWPDKKNLLLASNDLPDVFYKGALNTTDVAKYAQTGLFYDLDSYIEKDCPNLQKAFQEIPSYKAICTNPTDGKIYSIGRAAQRNNMDISAILFINKNWLDKLGLKVPTTIDEYKADLEAFKTRDPNGNGKQDEVPFSFAMQQDYTYTNLFSAFGICCPVLNPGEPNKFIQDEQNKAVYPPTTENYKKAVEYLHQMFAEGLINKEGFSNNDQSQLVAMGNSPTEILGSFASFDVANVIPQNRVGDYVPISPFTNTDGKKLWLGLARNGNVNGAHFVITKKCENPDAVMRWLDAHFDPTTSIELFLGPVGSTLTKTSSGMLDYVSTPSNMNYSSFRFKYAPCDVPCAIPNSSWGKTVAVMDEDVNRNNWLKEYYGSAMTQKEIYLLPTIAESQYILSTGADIDQYAQTQESKWLVNGGIEKDWDTFQKKLKDMGLDQYTKYMQNQVDRFQQLASK